MNKDPIIKVESCMEDLALEHSNARASLLSQEVYAHVGTCETSAPSSCSGLGDNEELIRHGAKESNFSSNSFS